MSSTEVEKQIESTESGEVKTPACEPMEQESGVKVGMNSAEEETTKENVDPNIETGSAGDDIEIISEVKSEASAGSEDQKVKSKGKLCKCSKCDLVNNIVLLFYNVNCQHILCVKCLQLLGHVSQLKCDTVLKNDAKCDALWTRKSTKIMTYVDPLFINAVTVELKSNASLNVDKSDTNVEVCLDSAALKMLRSIKPCIPGLPTLENPMAPVAEGAKSAETPEITPLDSPPRKRAKKSDGGQKEETTPAPRKTTSRQIAREAASATKTPTVKPAPAPTPAEPEPTKAEKEPETEKSASVASQPNPLLNRPPAENKPQNKIKLSAANDPATYKKVMKKNFKGETQLHAACQKGMLEKAREWLEMGSDPNTSDNANLRPIHEHGVIHKPELCQLLLEFGAEVNVAGGEENLMPLHIAISNNCVETARLLIKYGADLNATGKDALGKEFTAMSLAEKMGAEYGCTDLLQVVKETKREIFEAVKPPVAPVSGPPPKLGKPTVFSVSGLSDEEKSLVANFAEKFPERVTLSQNYNNDCNVLVCGKSKTKVSSYPPSIKVLAAILTNGNVIDIAWMRECLSNRTYLDYDNYLIDSVCGIKEGVLRARESGKTNPKKIFHGMKFFVSEKLFTFKYHEICLLIEIGDGQLLGTSPEPSAGKKLLNDPKIKIEFMKEDSMIGDMRLGYVTEDIFGHIEKIQDGSYKVSPDWIVNCVASYSLPSNVFPHCSSTDTANKPVQW